MTADHAPHQPVSSVRALLDGAAGGLLVGLTWIIHVYFGFMQWYPIVFFTNPNDRPSPLLAVPFLGLVGLGAAIALRTLVESAWRTIAIAFLVHGAVSFAVYQVISPEGFETQTPFHAAFFGIGAVATIVLCLPMSLRRGVALALTALGVGAAMVILVNVLWVEGQGMDPDLYFALQIGVAVAMWVSLAVVAAASSSWRSATAQETR